MKETYLDKPNGSRKEFSKRFAIEEGMQEVQEEKKDCAIHDFLEDVPKLPHIYAQEEAFRKIVDFFPDGFSVGQIKELVEGLAHESAGLVTGLIMAHPTKFKQLNNEILQSIIQTVPTEELDYGVFYKLVEISSDEEIKRRFVHNFEILEDFLKINKGIEPTALPALKLHLYNFIDQNRGVTAADLREEASRFTKLSTQEQVCKDDQNFLPTIGIEIEVPVRDLSADKVFILNRLKIPNYQERNLSLWEVNPNFSYAPGVQARIIQELASMGALPLEETPNSSLGKIPEDSLLSLHINFGVPRRLYEKDFDKKELIRINDLLTYGFTSPQRIRGRKMKNSYDIKHDAAGSSKGGYMRLELRAGEFRNYPTFRLLVESQRLIGLLFKVTEVKEHATSDDQKFITIYTELQTKIKNLFEKYKLSPKQMDDGVLEDDLVAKLATTDLQKECRSLISEYSKKVNELLKQTDQETVLVDEEEELLAA